MSGYAWAETPEGHLFVVLVVDGKGYVPGMENAIDLSDIAILEPVEWPTATLQNRSLPHTRRGERAAVATHECAILPFAASA
jgi:hypothetical protein